MDIVQLIRSIRQSNFHAQAHLKKHQLALIPNFKEYRIVAVKQAKGANGLLPEESIHPTNFLEEIEANFSPSNDKIDNRILQKITGFD